MQIRTAASLILLTTASIGTPPEVDAQSWEPISIGIHAGYDNRSRQEMLGAQLRIPVLPSGRVELMTNTDVTFLKGLKEYQTNFEAIYMLTPGGGGFYAGGGVGVRKTTLGVDVATAAERVTLQTFSVVTGAVLGNIGRIRPQLELRWIFIDETTVDPQHFTLGASFTLWERQRPT
jgi:hypothetical protein